jgi:putative nucleotidyltransferase with HDIG domain
MDSNLDKLVILLSRGLSQRRLYFAEHPKVEACARELVDQLHPLLDELHQDFVFIGVVEGKLVFNGRFLVGPSITGGSLVKLSNQLHCGGFTFRRATTAAEALALFTLAAELRDPTADLAESRQLLASRGITNIELAAAYHDGGGLAMEEDQAIWQGRDAGGRELPSPVLVYQALFDVVTTAHGNAALDQNLDIDSARSVSEHLLQSTRGSFTDLMQLVHYPDFDTYTVGHSVRVATLAVYAGDKLGLANEQLLDLGTAGLLHDVGKSKIPDEILFKRGKLDDDEFKVMKSHAALGAEILMEHKRTTPMDVAAAWGHHLRHDGGGYPERPPWAVRNPVTALLQVCDVFEALTAIRPYKPPMTPRKAYDIMLKDRGAFAPALLGAFISALGLYPPGNHVRLSDGSFGTVVNAGIDIERPVVQLTHDAAGRYLGESDRRIVDLGAGNEARLEVRELVLDPESVLA